MEYSIAKGPGPGKKKQARMAQKQYKADADAAKDKKEARAAQFNNPETKKKVGETMMRNNNVEGALKKGLGKLNEAGQWQGEQKATPLAKPKVKYKLTPKFQ